MQTLKVELGERSYAIRIGTGLSPADVLPAALRPGRALLVSDANVAPRYAQRWRDGLEACGIACRLVEIPAGEASKSLTWAGRLYVAAAEAGLDRRSLVIALGGGVVGDLAGFVAATYLRGLRLVQVPTSLLAMVDSSVGGKTAINIAAGKNLVGAFHQPSAVAIDLGTLTTLPEREYRSGLAEVIKYGVIRDATFFDWLATASDSILARDAGALRRLVARCCTIKAEVVGADERESGERAILNFGHTLAHAVETAAGYGQWLHGEAVAVGMVFAARLSQRLRGFAQQDHLRLVELLTRFGLPCRPPDNLNWEALRAVMARDKKTLDARPRLVLLERMGGAVYDCAIEDGLLEETWRACLGE